MRAISRFHDDQGNCVYFRVDEDAKAGQVDQITVDGNQMITFQGTPAQAADHFDGAAGDRLEGLMEERFLAFVDTLPATPSAPPAAPADDEADDE